MANSLTGTGTGTGTGKRRTRPSSIERSESSTQKNNNSNKKLKLHASYALESPFPHFTRPTSEEAFEVFKLLSNAHCSTENDNNDNNDNDNNDNNDNGNNGNNDNNDDNDPNRLLLVRKRPPVSVNSAESCGDVPNVLEALIGTILSQNTSSKNSSAAKANLDATFGRNNFAAIARAPQAEVVEAIRNGGLANKKAATIQALLRSVSEKKKKMMMMMKMKKHVGCGEGSGEEYSLQHLAETDPKTGRVISNDEIMQELMSYDGVGPKTASCVLLFCLGRDSFAVDTHVYRLSRLLGWVPDKANRVLAQAHLDIRVPDQLKYGLHVLMIQHGRTCKGCRKSGGGDCVLKMYLGKKDQKLMRAKEDLVSKSKCV